MNVYLFCTIICFIIFFSGLKKFWIHPFNIMCFVWGGATLCVYLYTIGFLPPPAEQSFEKLGEYILYFVLAGIAGGGCGWFINRSRNNDADSKHINLAKIDLILKKLSFVWGLLLFLGILRIVILISFSGVTNFLNYRIAAINAYSSIGSIYAIPMRIAAHVYIIGGFLVIFTGVIHGARGINRKELFIRMACYSLVTASLGGRLFILDFGIMYFTGFFIGKRFYSTRKTLQDKDIRSLAILLGCLILFVGIIAIKRSNEPKEYSGKKNLEALSYFGEGLRTANYVLTSYSNYKGQGEGKNFFKIGFGPQIDAYRQDQDYLNTSFRFTVHSIIPSLYFDFGATGMLIAWFLIMFACETIFFILLNQNNIYCLLFATMLCRFAFSSILGNPWGTLCIYVAWGVIFTCFLEFILLPSRQKNFR